MIKAITMDGKDPSLLTLAAHLRLRRGLFLREQGDAEGAQDCFEEAAKQYVGVFAFAPVRQVRVACLGWPLLTDSHQR
jgi:hypothetical protein